MSAWEDAGKSDDWFTPRYIFDAMGVMFWMDVAAPKEGPRYAPCIAWLWENSLEVEWQDFVWMNPPFGGRNGVLPWLEKFVAHKNGVALVPDRTSASWFQWAVSRMDSILFVSPKIKFERPDGSVGKSPGCGTALMAMGEHGCQALVNARRLGWLAVGA